MKALISFYLLSGHSSFFLRNRLEPNAAAVFCCQLVKKRKAELNLLSRMEVYFVSNWFYLRERYQTLHVPVMSLLIKIYVQYLLLQKCIWQYIHSVFYVMIPQVLFIYLGCS